MILNDEVKLEVEDHKEYQMSRVFYSAGQKTVKTEKGLSVSLLLPLSSSIGCASFASRRPVAGR